jgi:hypothetical protein
MGFAKNNRDFQEIGNNEKNNGLIYELYISV